MKTILTLLLLPGIALAAPVGFVWTPAGLMPKACAPTVASGAHVEPRTVVCPESQTPEARLVRYYPPVNMTGWMAFTVADNYAPAWTGKLRACWVVPFPSGYDGGVTHAFPGYQSLQPSAEQPGVEVMVIQPVCSQRGLDTACASWRCNQGTDCPNSTLIWAYAGDTICGTVEPVDCNLATGVCKAWTITTWNVTRGESTVLVTGVAGQRFTFAFGAVLEARNIDYCSHLPKGGKLTMTGVELWTYPDKPTIIPGAGVVGAPHGDRLYPAWYGYGDPTQPCNFKATAVNGVHTITWSSSP